jgi:sugar diacid utilization regulator
MSRALDSSFVSLVELAVASDDPARLATAAAEQGCLVGLVDPAGEALAHAPDDEDGHRAGAVAQAGARNGLVAPPDWHIVRLEGFVPLGFLAVGAGGSNDADMRTLLDLLPPLFVEQLTRGALLHMQQGVFVRRLISEPNLSPDEERREAAELGITLADAYWPGVLAWRNVPPPADLIAAVQREARRLADSSLTVVLDRRLVLLHGGTVADAGDSCCPKEWFEALVDKARRLAPSSRAQAIVAEGPIELEALAASVAQLTGSLRFGPPAKEDQPVVSMRQFGLDRLLWDNIARVQAERFVEERLGSLIAWDRDHRTKLLAVLEAALDFPRADQAATKCFMHRNTFRHRLHQAMQVLGEELDDPDTRLAVHVALKLRTLLLARTGEGADPPPRLAAVADPAHGQRGARPATARRAWPRSRSA